jgi:hypothetical protein
LHAADIAIRRWLQDANLVLQQVSQAPATRDDVINLQVCFVARCVIRLCSSALAAREHSPTSGAILP